jgi:hypothetical protein
MCWRWWEKRPFPFWSLVDYAYAAANVSSLAFFMIASKSI